MKFSDAGIKLPAYVKDYTHLFDWTDFWGEPIPEKYKYAAVDWNGLLYVYSEPPSYNSNKMFYRSESDLMYIGVVSFSGASSKTLKIRENYPSEICEIEKCIDILEKQGYIVSLPRNAN